MKSTFFIIFLLLLSQFLTSCFTTQGAYEDYQNRKYFAFSFAKRNHFEKFTGEISLDTLNTRQIRYVGNSILDTVTVWKLTYDNVSMTIISEDKREHIPIYFSGLIPEAVYNHHSFLDRQKTISIKELQYLKKRHRRRFKFLIWTDMANPSVYLVEYTNKKARRRTDLETFMKNAKVTIVHYDRIQI